MGSLSIFAPKASKNIPTASLENLPALPLESLESSLLPSITNSEKQRDAFDQAIQNLKSDLLQARRQAILARSQSMEISKRQALCQEALALYQSALEHRKKLRSLSLRMGLEDRRKVRGIEGASEWRAIRHAIQKSAELNQVAMSFAA